MVVPFVYTEEEYKKLEERVKFLEEENNNLKDELMEDMKYETELEKENKNLKLTLEQMENTCKDYLNDRDTLREENKKLKEKLLFYKGRWKQNKFGGWYFEVKKPKDIQN